MKWVLVIESTQYRLIRHSNYKNNCTGMYMEHANVVFYLYLTCLREYEIRTLHDSHLLSAPRILPLPNSLGPCLLRTAGPLSLPLPISFTLLRLPTFHICEPLLNVFFIFLALLLHFSSCSIRCHHSAAHLASRSTCSLALVDYSVSSHCMKSQRGGGLYFQAELELTY